MTISWVEAAKEIAPIAVPVTGLIGVYIGGGISRRSSSQAFMRERIFREMEKRREVAATFRRDLWLYASRVEKMRDLAKAISDAKQKGVEAKFQYDLKAAQDCQRAVLTSYAELEMYAVMQVQLPARACMESLTKSFNHSAEHEISEAFAAFAFYQQQYEILSIELNKEVDQFNLLIYSHSTPFHRILLGRVLRRPLPFKAMPHPVQMNNPKEGAVLKLGRSNDARSE